MEKDLTVNIVNLTECRVTLETNLWLVFLVQQFLGEVAMGRHAITVEDSTIPMLWLWTEYKGERSGAPAFICLCVTDLRKEKGMYLYTI